MILSSYIIYFLSKIQVNNMKGISVWIWVVGGIILGLLMFTVLFQIVSFMLASRDASITKDNFQQLASVVSRFCDSRVGSKTTQSALFKNVDFMYASSSGKTFNVINNRTFGRYFCINMSNELVCERTSCMIEVTTSINATAEKERLGGELAGITGKEMREYLFSVEKQRCGVVLIKVGEKASEIMKEVNCTIETNTTTTTTIPNVY